MKPFKFAVATVLLSFVAGFIAAQAQTQSTSDSEHKGFQKPTSMSGEPDNGNPAIQHCNTLLKFDGDALVDAPTRILSAKVFPAADGLPEFCEVRGYVTTQVQFAVRLPTTTWNGKLLETGCGGFCGAVMISLPWDDAALKRGYAVTTTDMGHVGNGYDGEWAYNNLQGKIDFGYRATHVNIVAAKAIVAAFYKEPQKYAYFQGCSTGGRQGLVEAQKFPEDFDGVVSGAPALYYTTSNFALLWEAISTLDEDDRPILAPEDVKLVHKAVLDRCDALDGLKDGIIDEPRKCDFKPAMLLCKEGETTACLTPQKVESVRRIYQGAVNSKGQQIHPGGAALPGSELNWIGPYVGTETTPPIYRDWMVNKFRYMTFFEDPGPSWTLKDLDWDKDPARAKAMDIVYSGTNPDLRKFKAHGGKILGYSGWADQSVHPGQWLDYYSMVEKTMGGQQPTQEFLRLFMIPGMNHCMGGVGADTVDYLPYLENWVEKGQAPEKLVGAHIEDGKTKFTRPFFPYPDVARYTGKGDVNDAANWKRQASQP
jgi:hypothetical protein